MAKGQKLCKTIIVFLHFYDLKFYCTLRVLTQTDRVGGNLWGKKGGEAFESLYRFKTPKRNICLQRAKNLKHNFRLKKLTLSHAKPPAAVVCHKVLRNR